MGIAAGPAAVDEGDRYQSQHRISCRRARSHGPAGAAGQGPVWPWRELLAEAGDERRAEARDRGTGGSRRPLQKAAGG